MYQPKFSISNEVLANIGLVEAAKKAAEELYQKVGFAYNADDLTDKIPEVLGKYLR